VTYLIEYLGEFEFIFETVLGYISGDQMGYFEAKKRSRKSHAWAPLKGQKREIFHLRFFNQKNPPWTLIHILSFFL
jgi:hypothetical protein